jgi:hypothetical protein
MIVNNCQGVRTIAFESLSLKELEYLRSHRITASTVLSSSQLRVILEELYNASL